MPQAELLLEKGVTEVINIHNKHSINQFYTGEKYANLPYNHVYIIKQDNQVDLHILLTNVLHGLIPFMKKAVLHLLG